MKKSLLIVFLLTLFPLCEVAFAQTFNRIPGEQRVTGDIYTLKGFHGSSLDVSAQGKFGSYVRLGQKTNTQLTSLGLSSGDAGAVAWSTTDSRFKGFNGTSWADLGTLMGDVTVSAPSSSLISTDDSSTLQSTTIGYGIRFTSGTRKLEADLPYFDVRAYGAENTCSDDATADVIEAVDDLEAAGTGKLYWPAGCYLLSGNDGAGNTHIAIDGRSTPIKNVIVQGEGAVLRMGQANSLDDSATNRVLGIFGVDGFLIEGLEIAGWDGGTIDADRSRDTGIVVAYGSSNGEIRNNLIYNSLGDGITITPDPTNGSVLGETCKNIIIENNTLQVRQGNGIPSYNLSGYPQGTKGRWPLTIIDADAVTVHKNHIYGQIDNEPNANGQAIADSKFTENQILAGGVLPKRTIDSDHWERESFQDNGNLESPKFAPVLTDPGGGSIAAGTYRVRYSYASASGESWVSPKSLITLSAGSSSLKADCGALPANVTAVKVYVSPSSSALPLLEDEVYAGQYTSGTSLTLTALPSAGAAVPPTPILGGIRFTGSPSISNSFNNTVSGNTINYGGVEFANTYVANVEGNTFDEGYINAGTSTGGGTSRGFTVANNTFKYAYSGGYTSEVQTVTFGGTPTGGTFTLAFNGQTSSSITWSSTNATLKGNVSTALQSLSSVGTDNIAVNVGTMTAGIGTLTVTFAGTLRNQDVPAISVGTNSLTGTSPTISITETTAGVPPAPIRVENTSFGHFEGNSIRNAPKGTLYNVVSSVGRNSYGGNVLDSSGAGSIISGSPAATDRVVNGTAMVGSVPKTEFSAITAPIPIASGSPGVPLLLYGSNAVTGSTDQDGGDVKIIAGNATGAGSSSITLATAQGGGSGTVTRAASDKWTLDGEGTVTQIGQHHLMYPAAGKGSDIYTDAGASVNYNSIVMVANGKINPGISTGGATITQRNTSLASWILSVGGGNYEFNTEDTFRVFRLPAGGTSVSDLFGVNSSGQPIFNGSTMTVTASELNQFDPSSRTTDFVPAANGSGGITWKAITSLGGGTVEEVTADAPLTVTNGTTTPNISLGTPSANTVLAGPASGAAAAPTFRAQVAADIPSLDTAKLTSGTLGVPRGGTGAATFSANGVLYGNGTSALQTTGLGLVGEVLAGTGGAPAFTDEPSLTSLALHNLGVPGDADFERLKFDWNSNVARIYVDDDGLGVGRSFKIAAYDGTSNNTSITLNRAAAPYVDVQTSSNAVTGDWYRLGGTSTASSLVTNIFSVSPTISQSSTAGYTASLVNVTESATGSGPKLLSDWQVGGTSKASISNGGAIVAAGSVMLGVTRKITVTPDFAGLGDMPNGSLIGSSTADNLSIATATGAGTTAKKVVLAAYNGTAWKSMVEYANTSGGTAGIVTMGSGGASVRFPQNTASTLAYFDTNKDLKSVTLGSGLSLASGTLSLSALGGDLSGSTTSATVEKIRGNNVPAPGASEDEKFLKYDHNTTAMVWAGEADTLESVTNRGNTASSNVQFNGGANIPSTENLSVDGSLTLTGTFSASAGTMLLAWGQATTSSFNVTNGMFTILGNATSNNVTINLPAAASSSGRILSIKKIDSSGNTVTIDPNGAETIDGSATKVLSTQYESVWLICANSGWYILSSN